MKMQAFRQLNNEDESEGYQLICDTVVWLMNMGIKMWEKPLPRDVYAARQGRKENFGLFVDGQLASIVSLVRGAPACWCSEFEEMGSDVMWICTLTTANPFRGQRIGQSTVEQALAFLAQHNETGAYLDCVPGFLVSFYEALGFEALATRQFLAPGLPSGTVEVVLMHKMICSPEQKKKQPNSQE